jgi:ceramide glucosyltransferase
MALVLLIVQSALGLMLAAFGFYSGLTVWAARKWAHSRTALTPEFLPPVTILKPVRGVDAHAYTNFVSFCRLDYPADRVQLLFSALDADDPALELAERLQAEFPERDIEIVRPGSEAMRGPNRKVCNLAAMLPTAKHELLVLCDSDMRVEPDYLRRLVAPFRPAEATTGRGVGLVTCPYRGCAPESLPAALEALGIGSDFIPSALVSRALEGVSFAFGSTIALPKSVLAELGGFEALFDELADDFRLGNGAAQAGYTVVLSEVIVDDVLGAERFGPMWSRRLRWARTVRSCRPAGYAGAVITHGIALALLFLLASHFALYGWLIFGTVLLLRLGVALFVAHRYTRDPNIAHFLPLLPLSDLLGFALYVGSYCGSRIVWRGERFRLLPGGKLLRE